MQQQYVEIVRFSDELSEALPMICSLNVYGVLTLTEGLTAFIGGLTAFGDGFLDSGIETSHLYESGKLLWQSQSITFFFCSSFASCFVTALN